MSGTGAHPNEFEPAVVPTYSVDIEFRQIRDGHIEHRTYLSAAGSQAFVARVTEAGASAFEEEATR
ncbi:hypothetical protein CDO52_00830 [Nocardiopsis gilva YIM 90087]|uniref:Uncharacterized protein n=1 Tax=Nocardiopsis gilva YIM 90087 TaxID=1235441 RepID=A0A223S059_9ACTN|nr:hypothetical protein [Nocardiopsis gilva]ASU81523.1 hypothetical protein CDO52_00830 [Nocardiopsis gilva YIM 90087]